MGVLPPTVMQADSFKPHDLLGLSIFQAQHHIVTAMQPLLIAAWAEWPGKHTHT